MKKQLGMIGLMFVLGGCGLMSSDAARVQFAQEFHCPEERVTLEEVGGAAFRASGCGESAVYVCRVAKKPMAGKSGDASPCARDDSYPPSTAQANPGPAPASDK